MKKRLTKDCQTDVKDASSQNGASFSLSNGSETEFRDYAANRLRASQLSKSSFRLILGSRSPRRSLLLQENGYSYAILPSEDGVEENSEANEPRDVSPSELVSELAFLKAKNVVERLTAPNSIERKEIAKEFESGDAAPFVVAACDSVAVCKGEIMGKPLDRADAERMLRKLSGSLHSVQTGLCLWRTDPTGRASDRIVRRIETSVLQMEPLSEEQLRSYLESGLWQGKAGAFGYQDGNDWLELVSGSASNVVGLPLEALAATLKDILDESEG